MTSPSQAYRSRAVRALVLLHEEHLRRFLLVWKEARAASVTLPQTADPAYASLDTLLLHVLRAARGYMTWMCEVLELPDPEIRVAPEAASLSGEADGYMEHVLEKWRTPLLDVGDDRLETRSILLAGRRAIASTRCLNMRSCIPFGMRSNSKT